MGARQSLSLFL